MGHYLANFVVYTMAMTGLICFAVFVYKKLCSGEMYTKDSHTLRIEETLSLNPRKTLMIVSAGNERFLVASDVDKTSLISKLGTNEQCEKIENYQINNLTKIPYKQNVQDNKQIIPNQKQMAEMQKATMLSQEQQSHLDEIYPKNGRNYQHLPKKQNNTVVLDFNKPKNHGLDSIKEMARKINEL